MDRQAKTTIWLSTIMLIVILTSSIYFVMQDNVKIVVENTRTKFYVFEDNKWVLGGTEYVQLWDGVVKMRAKSRDVSYNTIDTITTIVRTSIWKDNITVYDTYTFDSTVENVELIPIEHKVECINCEGKIVHFEYRDILYDGETREAISPESFGHRMKVEWQDGYDWAKVYQQKIASDKLIVRYRPENEYETYYVRMFDPIWFPTGYQYIRNITDEPTSSLAFSINQSNGVGDNIIWTNPGSGNGDIYCAYNDSNIFSVVNDTSFIPYEIESTGLGYTPESVYGENTVIALHLTSVNDSTSNNFHGTNHGADSNSTACAFGGCYEFKDYGATADYISLPDIEDYLGTEYSISLWYYSTNYYGEPILYATNGNSTWYNFHSYNNNMGFTVSDADGNTAVVYKVLAMNIWHHVVGVRDGNVIHLYHNGTYVGNSSKTFGAFASTMSWHAVGADDPEDSIQGFVDEITIYNRTLTATEISDLYTNYLTGGNMNLGTQFEQYGVCSDDEDCFEGNCDAGFNTITKYCHPTATDCVNPDHDGELANGYDMCINITHYEECASGVWGADTHVTTGDVCDSGTTASEDPSGNSDCGFNNDISCSCETQRDCTLSACFANNYYTGYDSGDCIDTGWVDQGTNYNVPDNYIIDTTENTTTCSTINTGKSSSFDDCSDLHTKTGPDGYCDGAGSLDTNDNIADVDVGDVCRDGTSEDPSGDSDCGTDDNDDCSCATWYECIAGACTMSDYYTGYDSGSCTATGWVDQGTDTNVAENVTVATTENVLTCTENTSNYNDTVQCDGDADTPYYDSFNASYTCLYETDTSGYCDGSGNAGGEAIVCPLSSAGSSSGVTCEEEVNEVGCSGTTLGVCLNASTETTIELGSVLNISVDASADTVCVDINHSVFGTNYSCYTSGDDNVLSITIPYFRLTKFNDSSSLFNLTYIGAANHTYYISSHEYDDIEDLKIDLIGYETNGTYPQNVSIYINNTLSNYIGPVLGVSSEDITVFNDDDSAKNTTFNGAEIVTVGYFELFNSATNIEGFLNITGYNVTYRDDTSTTQDNNYTTTENSNINYRYSNFTKKTSSISSTYWEVKHGTLDAYNITMSDQESCWDYNETLIELRIKSSYGSSVFSSRPQCYNGSEWLNMGVLETSSTRNLPSTVIYGNDSLLFDNNFSTYAAQLININVAVPKNGTVYDDFEDNSVNYSLWSDSGDYVGYNGTSESNGKLRSAVGWGTPADAVTKYWSVQTDKDFLVGADKYYIKIEGNIGCKLGSSSHKCWADLWMADEMINLTGAPNNGKEIVEMYYVGQTYPTGPFYEYGNFTIFVDNVNNLMSAWNETTSIFTNEDISGYSNLYIVTYNKVYVSGAVPGYSTISDTYLYDTKYITSPWSASCSSGDCAYANIYEDSVHWAFTRVPEDAWLEIGTVGAGDREWNYTGNYSSEEEVNISDALTTYLSSCTTSPYCYIPVHLYSTYGLLEISDINISYNQSATIANLNTTLIETFLNNSDGFVEIPITFESLVNGTLEVQNPRFDYYGGNDTYEIIVHTPDYTSNDTGEVNYYYSDWDYSLPTNINSLVFAPSSSTSTNVEPWGQTSSIPFLNITAQNRGGKEFTWYSLVENSEPCVTLKMSNSSDSTTAISLSAESWENIKAGVSFETNFGVWLWADYACGYSGWTLFQPSMYFRTCCDGCSCSEDTS